MSDALYIIAKAPRAGLAKTRLGRAIGDEAAIVLYKAFLKDLAARFAKAPFECGWYVTPPDAWDDISPLVDWDGREVKVLLQGEGDLGERQRELFRGAAARGEEKVVLIASDSPHLDVGVVERAFRELGRHDLVFGPTYDGGYYLIGMRAFEDVFCGVPMSVGTELEDIAAAARLAGLSVGRVETTFDVDEVEDLVYLRSLLKHRTDLAATGGALEALGLLKGAEGYATAEPKGLGAVFASPGNGTMPQPRVVEPASQPRGGGSQ